MKIKYFKVYTYFCIFPENERRIRANDREFNAQFKYAVSINKNYNKYLYETYRKIFDMKEFYIPYAFKISKKILLKQNRELKFVLKHIHLTENGAILKYKML